MTKSTRNIILVGIASLTAFAFAKQGEFILYVNGIKSSNAVITEGENTYVSLQALKNAGAEVSVANSRVSIQFKPLKDMMQVDAVEGAVGEWVQNQGWRVKVHSITPAKSPFGKGGGFTVKFEFRNLTGKPMNFGASGLKGMQLFDASGNSMRHSVSSFKDLYKAAAPGNGYTNTIAFGLEAGDTRSVGDPVKLLILFGQSGKNRFKDIRIDLLSK